MSLEVLAGRVYGPVHTSISAAKSAEYVAATCDDAARWVEAAPPSYAGALLFAVAPSLIHDPDVGDHARVLVHSDQRFTWHGPLLHGADVAITGTVTRVRERAGMSFVTLEVAVEAGGEPLVTSTSTFLMGSEAPGEPGPDEGEPPVTSGTRCSPVPGGRPTGGRDLPTVVRSASRLDLVRYAAASGDFNPIHFDHEAARNAGLDGIVVHGLLMAAWMAQLAYAGSPGLAPLLALKVRFRQALRPAVSAEVGGRVERSNGSPPQASLRLRQGETDLVTAQAVLSDDR